MVVRNRTNIESTRDDCDCTKRSQDGVHLGLQLSQIIVDGRNQIGREAGLSWSMRGKVLPYKRFISLKRSCLLLFAGKPSAIPLFSNCG
jgi:hypothetical protein